MGFSRQQYWSGLPFPSPGGLPNPGIKPGSPALQADSLPSDLPGKYTHTHTHTHIYTHIYVIIIRRSKLCFLICIYFISFACLFSLDKFFFLVLCWVEVMRVGILTLCLILEENPSAFTVEYDASYEPYIYTFIMLKYISSIPDLLIY